MLIFVASKGGGGGGGRDHKIHMLFFVIINGVLFNFFLCLDLVLECSQSLLSSSCFVVVFVCFVVVCFCFLGLSNWI